MCEDQCEYLYKTGQLSDEAKKFFADNGYIDADGDFSFSERYIEILSKIRDNGNNQMNALILFQQYGLIPRSLLTYTKEEADSFDSQEAFDDDYFNMDMVSSQMLTLGQQSKRYINLSRQWIGKSWTTPPLDVLRAALRQAPLVIGIPIPANPALNWNKPFVQYDGGTDAAHAVELYGIDDKGQYLIYDQYHPELKTLSADYFIAICTQGIVNPVKAVIVNPIPQDISFNLLWEGIIHWFNGIFDAKVPIGDVST